MKLNNVMHMSLIGCSALIMVPAIAIAQERPQDERERTLNTVTVTAQNRSEDVQDVPIAINVITGEAFAKSGIVDMQGLSAIAPQVQVVNDTPNTRVTLRGVGTNSNDEAQDSSIAISIDGEYLNRPTALNASLFDLERIEVLRGPQGTLYGRTATGGAINFITRKPGDQFGINASATYGNFEQLNLDLGVDVPLGSRAAVRVAVTDVSNEGWVFHPNFNERSNDQNYTAGRIGLRLEPTDALDIYLAVELVDLDQASKVRSLINLNLPQFSANDGTGNCNTALGWVEFSPLVPGVQCRPVNTNFRGQIDPDNFASPVTGTGFFKSEVIAYRGEANYDLGPAVLTYRFGMRETNNTSDTPLGAAFLFKSFQDDIRTQSHELRLAGVTEGGIKWQGGTFFFSEELEVDRGLFQPFIGPNGSYVTYFTRPIVESDSWAVFGQADIPITDTLTAVIGGRHTSDERSAIYGNYGFVFNTGPTQVSQDPSRTPTILNLASDAEEFTWLLGLNYKPSENQLLYGKVSTGFKPGGFDAIGPYAPETVTALEAGSKNRFGDGRYLFNATAFYYDYADLQVGVLLDSTIGNQVFNAGVATIWGLEAEFEAAISTHGQLKLSANYLNAEYDEFRASVPVQCIGCALNGVGNLDLDGPGVTQPNLAGNTPPFSPDWIVQASYDHTWDLTNGAALVGAISGQYKGNYNASVFNYADTEQDPTVTMDASLTYDSGGKWSFSAFGRNLSDARPLTYGEFTSAGAEDNFGHAFAPPRTYGVRLTVEY